jgi:hypothetical protein
MNRGQPGLHVGAGIEFDAINPVLLRRDWRICKSGGPSFFQVSGWFGGRERLTSRLSWTNRQQSSAGEGEQGEIIGQRLVL